MSWTKTEIHDLLIRQKAFFQTGKTLSIPFRMEMLRKLREAVISHEQDLTDALEKDLGRNPAEGYGTAPGYDDPHRNKEPEAYGSVRDLGTNRIPARIKNGITKHISALTDGDDFYFSGSMVALLIRRPRRRSV